jgi:excisionase family DNA binding protein
MMNNQSHQDGILSSSSPLFEQTAIDYTSPLWTVEEVAGYLKLQPETVRSMARRGELPAIKLGKVWRFRKTAIHEMLANMG